MKNTLKALVLMTFTLLTAAITVFGAAASAPLPGDINGDGKVTVVDSVVLMQYLAGADVSCIYNAMDVNGDKMINKQDVGALVKFIVRIRKEANIEPACAHNGLANIPATVTCTEDGSREYWQCPTCQIKFSDNSATVAVTDRYLAAKAGHKEAVLTAVAPTCTATGLTEGKHCSACKQIILEQTTIPKLNHIGTDICTGCGENLLIPNDVRSEIGYITTEDTVIETKYFVLHIPANVYVPADIVKNLDLIGEIMEEVSGLTSAGNPHYQYGTTKTPIYITKPNIPDNPEQETAVAFASSGGAYLYSYDMVFYDTLIHEAAHAFQQRHSEWAYCKWAMEMISTYTTYKVQKYMEDNYPDLYGRVEFSNYSLYIMEIYDYSKLYEHTMGYWAENAFNYSGNNNYAIGFRFAWYLDEVYGDYTKWIRTYEEMYPAHSSSDDILLSTEEQLKAFKLTYGDDIFENFYTWMQKNEDLFEFKHQIDIQTIHKIDLYPQFTAGNGYHIDDTFVPLPTRAYYLISPGVWELEYSDLYINLQPGNFYLSKYKNKNIDKLELTVSGGITMNFYDSEGKYIKTVMSSGEKETFEISGVDFIKLVGTGTLNLFPTLLFDDGYHTIETFDMFTISGYQ